MTKLYTPIEMLEAMRELPQLTTFAQDQFVTKVTESDKTYVEVDNVAATSAKAEYTDRNGIANVVTKQGYTSKLHVAPYVNEQIDFTVGDILDQVPAGFNAYNANSASALQIKTAEWLKQLTNRHAQLKEYQLMQALQTGKITVSGLGVSYEIDFGLSSSNKEALSAGNVWGTTTDMIGQLQSWCDRLADKGYVATKLLLDRKSANLFVNDTTIKALLNNLRIERGMINPVVVAGQRATYLGDINAPGMNLSVYSYEAKYQTAADTYAGMMTDYRALVIGEGLEVEQVYCRIDNANTGTFRGQMFPQQWWEPNGRIGHISVESSPLAVIKNPNAIFSAITVS